MALVKYGILCLFPINEKNLPVVGHFQVEFEFPKKVWDGVNALFLDDVITVTWRRVLAVHELLEILDVLCHGVNRGPRFLEAHIWYIRIIHILLPNTLFRFHNNGILHNKIIRKTLFSSFNLNVVRATRHLYMYTNNIRPVRAIQIQRNF